MSEVVMPLFGEEAQNDAISDDQLTLFDRTLTPYQNALVQSLSLAMAEKFSVQQEDFSVLTIKSKKKSQSVLAYTALRGLKRGPWNRIFNEQYSEYFMIDCEDSRFDTREGMTEVIYRVFLGQAVEREQALPDSYRGPYEPKRTRTYLTGDRKVGQLAPVAQAYKDRGGDLHIGVTEWPRHTTGFDDSVRFRPAIILPNR